MVTAGSDPYGQGSARQRRLRLVPRQAGAATTEATRDIWLEWGGAFFKLGLPYGSWDAWIASRFPDIGLDALPAEFVEAAIEALVSDAVFALFGQGGGPLPRLLDAVMAIPRAEPPHHWLLFLEDEHSRIETRISVRTDDAGLQCLAALLDGQPGELPNRSVEDLVISLRQGVGATALSLRMLSRLAVGDVMLLDRYAGRVASEVSLTRRDGRAWCWGAVAMPVPHAMTYGENEVTTDETRDPGQDDFDMAAPADNAGAAPSGSHLESEDELLGDGSLGGVETEHAAADVGPDGRQDVEEMPLAVDEVPVTVTFDVGERSLTVGELRSMREGELFDLQRPIEGGPVYMRVNGALLGVAELVDIGGHIGARVLRLESPRRAPCR